MNNLIIGLLKSSEDLDVFDIHRSQKLKSSKSVLKLYKVALYIGSKLKSSKSVLKLYKVAYTLAQTFNTVLHSF